MPGSAKSLPPSCFASPIEGAKATRAFADDLDAIYYEWKALKLFSHPHTPRHTSRKGQIPEAFSHGHYPISRH